MAVAPSNTKQVNDMLFSLFNPISKSLRIFFFVYILPILLFLVVGYLIKSSESEVDGLVKLIFYISSGIVFTLYALILLLLGALSLSGILELLIFLILSLIFGVSYTIVLNNINEIFRKTKNNILDKSKYLKTASGLALLGLLSGVVILIWQLIESNF